MTLPIVSAVHRLFSTRSIGIGRPGGDGPAESLKDVHHRFEFVFRDRIYAA